MASLDSQSALLDLDLGWGIGEDAFRMLVGNLSSIDPKYIIEFGSGPSSVRLAQAFPRASILSIEHDHNYWMRTSKLKEFFMTEDEKLEVTLRPLRWQTHGIGLYKCYSVGYLPDSLDAIIIDGPPHSTRRGREACLYQAINQLRRGGRVYLDDYAREDEKQIVENWQATFPGVFEVDEISRGHRVCVLTKVKESLPRLSLFVVRDNWVQNIRFLRGKIFQRKAKTEVLSSSITGLR